MQLKLPAAGCTAGCGPQSGKLRFFQLSQVGGASVGCWVLPAQAGSAEAMLLGCRLCEQKSLKQGRLWASRALRRPPCFSARPPAGRLGAAVVLHKIHTAVQRAGDCVLVSAGWRGSRDWGGGAGRCPAAAGTTTAESLACLLVNWALEHTKTQYDKRLARPSWGVLCSEEDLTIRLELILEPDLWLQFSDRGLFEDWARGLRLLLRLLTGPQGLHGGAGARWGGAGPPKGLAPVHEHGKHIQRHAAPWACICDRSAQCHCA